MAVYIYQPYVHIQTTAASIWTITHGLGRDTTVTIFDSTGKVINARVEKLSVNQVKISFFEKGAAKNMTGRAIIG